MPSIAQNDAVELDFGPSCGSDPDGQDRPVVPDRPPSKDQPDQTSLVKTPVNSICDFSIGEHVLEQEPEIIDKEPIVIKTTDEEPVITDNDEPVIIKMTDDVIESDDDSDDVITIPVEDENMSVKNEIFDLRMPQNDISQSQMTHNPMTHSPMTHNKMSHNQMNHNQMLHSLRQNVQFESKRKFNNAQFQNQIQRKPSDWSMQMTNQIKKPESSLQFKPLNTPESSSSRLSSSSFSSGLPSSIDFDQPGSPPASLDGFTTYVINQENFHRNELYE